MRDSQPRLSDTRTMTLDEYNSFCASLQGTTHVVQWGGAHVWKVGGKVFAIAGWNDGGELAVTYKVSEMAFDILRELPGCRPAPYLASRGMKWIQRLTAVSMDDQALKDYLRESRRLVIAGMTRKRREALGSYG
jgi:predicted DNA-binding protein (MmcQ/YjbR family)